MGRPVLSDCRAVVIIADLTAIGDQPGLRLISSAASPAMCGAANEVPLWKPNRSPSRAGELAISTLTPGAPRSGLTRSSPLARVGPREEERATVGAVTVGASTPAVITAVAVPVSPR